MVVLFLLQIRILLSLRLVQPVDNGVFSLHHMDLLDLINYSASVHLFQPVYTHLPLVFEAHLACCHASVLFQIRPWSIDDRYVILLVAFRNQGSDQGI